MCRSITLTSKNRIACEHILKGDSAKVAMQKAGYAPVYCEKHACDFLKHRLIAEYLRKRQEEIAYTNTIDIAYVYRELSKIVNKNGVDEKDKVAALKVLKEALNETKELSIKLEVAQSSSKESEESKQTPINITINEIKPNG
jgi:phage terminase small subunit